ncbi:thioredoxin domain-containing protein [Candidatus Saccharibacteria bacterium]|nr:thioredoxin domain-containing protein [Candidatus Saccharibacteria bacterium]
MQKKSYTAGIVLAIIVVAFLALLGVNLMNKHQNQVNYDDYDLSGYIGPNEFNGEIGDNVKGDKDKAKVYVVEYADFQCPGCAGLNAYVNKIPASFDDKVAVIYRNFIMDYHQNGTAAASAAEAAGLQGYWKAFGDLLFSNQADWQYADVDERTELFVSYFNTASGNKGDVDKFKSDMNSKEVQKKLKFDQDIANKIDVPGTPSLYLNGERLDYSSTKTEEEFLKFFHEKIDPLLK